MGGHARRAWPLDFVLDQGCKNSSMPMSVHEIWRYPVKTLGGEHLDSARLDECGLAGDRRWAVWDEEKDEATWAGAVPRLMMLQARTTSAGTELMLPDGAVHHLDDPRTPEAVSSVVGRRVAFRPVPRHVPEAPIHLLTTAALRQLAADLPDCAVNVSRFRPNLLLDADESGYLERRWLGRILQVGGTTLRISRGCSRCVMTTLATPSAPRDRRVLRWIAGRLDNMLGVYADVLTPGTVRVGDPVHLV
jgi:hypothetical protein